MIKQRGVRLEDFDFALPAERIAQFPPERRGASRLMVLDRKAEHARDQTVSELPAILREGDLLVVNDTRVIPARLVGRKASTGGRAELLLVRPIAQVATARALEDGGAWLCLGQASKGFKPGAEVEFDGGWTGCVLELREAGQLVVQFHSERGEALAVLLEKVGRLPLPPYIEREPRPEDEDRYQTIYARVPGSVAAPTAGLHFTPALLEALEARGIRRASITLDVGPGTFLPVRGDLAAHVMHAERYGVPEATAEIVSAARREGRRIVAVGTTAVRTLESAWTEEGGLEPGPGETTLFIRPGHRFRAVDALITNFHLPRSTLLMLVCAFAGTERVLSAYRAAVDRGYRFFSYGDAMLVEGGR